MVQSLVWLNSRIMRVMIVFRTVETRIVQNSLLAYCGAQNPDCPSPGRQDNAEVDVLERPKVKRPSQYEVLMLNDDYTPMDFVVYVLTAIFSKSTEEAVELMLQVHHKGRAICGAYPFEIAETKVAQVMSLARAEQYPLRCTLEKQT